MAASSYLFLSLLQGVRGPWLSSLVGERRTPPILLESFSSGDAVSFSSYVIWTFPGLMLPLLVPDAGRARHFCSQSRTSTTRSVHADPLYVRRSRRFLPVRLSCSCATGSTGSCRIRTGLRSCCVTMIGGEIADARLTCAHCGEEITAHNVTPEPRRRLHLSLGSAYGSLRRFLRRRVTAGGASPDDPRRGQGEAQCGIRRAAGGRCVARDSVLGPEVARQRAGWSHSTTSITARSALIEPNRV